MVPAGKFVTFLCAVAVLLSTTFVPTVASASTINTEIASNPAATIAEIEKIGLPMSDEMAGEVRGEAIVIPAWMAVLGWFSLGMVTYAHYLGVTNYDYLKTQSALFDLYLTTGGAYQY